MINAGRYKTCFAELSPEIQADVLKRMERLIEENRLWYDRGNYGHLCNILPHTDFIRTQTLCQGGDLCDFRFVRHAKGEQWERTKSI